MMKWFYEKLELPERLKKYRQDLHRIPELAFQETDTASYIQNCLDELGIQYESQVAGTGILAYIPGEPGGKTYCFRADMDALQVEEQTGLDFQSQKPGCMHACGHDGHMSILLGLAAAIASDDVKTKDHIVFLFQPGEEGTGGADIIVQSGILDQYEVCEIYGLHLFPEINQGTLGIASGPMMAQNSEIDITVWGENAHGGMPHTGKDALMIASQLLTAFQSIISRNINPVDPAVITFGTLKGGEVRNMIARKATMEGTIRTFTEESYRILKKRLLSIIEGFELTYDCRIDVDLRELYPAVHNPEGLVDQWKEAQGEKEIIEIAPIMLAEDFSFYQRKYPGLFFFLGTKNQDKDLVYPLHHGCFNFDEEVLMIGVESFLNILLKKGSIEFNHESERV
ncbi:hippurate hydrolase [Tindallia magadiensis]|uniref:Hippurate hydrolase n=2 Tax=Tindallia magadiensis TaxID=69895 RepID=A0A1I3FU90_9FIRM|nr:hippurate hydrolase [Tindallia magadiensis]